MVHARSEGAGKRQKKDIYKIIATTKHQRNVRDIKK